MAVQKKTLAEMDYNRLASKYALIYAYLKNRRIKKAINILKHVMAV